MSQLEEAVFAEALEKQDLQERAPPPEDPRLYVVRARAFAALGDDERACGACD
jgi:hypothetical protein